MPAATVWRRILQNMKSRDRDQHEWNVSRGSVGPGLQPAHLPPPLPTPSLLRTISAGQKPVKAEWRRCAPTKTASQILCGFTQLANARLSRTMVPARARIAFSIFIGECFEYYLLTILLYAHIVI